MTTTTTRPRRMPSMRAIAAHHNTDAAACYRCGDTARTERAHVIDRALGGLDDVQNIVPLCYRCHADMPPFAAGEERRAWLWLAHADWWSYALAIADLVIGSGLVAPNCSREAINDALARLELFVADAEGGGAA